MEQLKQQSNSKLKPKKTAALMACGDSTELTLSDVHIIFNG